MERELKYSILTQDLVLKSKKADPVIPDVYVSEYLMQRLEEHGDKCLFIDGATGNTMTARQVRESGCSIALSLLDFGVADGDFVLAFCPNNSLLATALLSCSLIGAVFTACEWDSPTERLVRRLQDTGSRVILCSVRNIDVAVEAVEKAPLVTHIIVMDGDKDEAAPAPGVQVLSVQQLLQRQGKNSDPRLPIVPLKSPPETAVLTCMYSTGTTGVPKGVLHTHRNLMFHLVSGSAEDNFRFDPRTVSPMTTAFTVGSTTILVLLNMRTGSTAVLMDGFQVEPFLSIIQKYGGTGAMMASPVIGKLNLAAPGLVSRYDVSSFTHMVAAAAPISVAAMRETMSLFPGLKSFQRIYGMTELGLVAQTPPELVVTTSVGHPIPGVRIKIVDRETGEPRGFNEVGEILIQSPSHPLGYLNRADADAENFTQDRQWLKSGDAGYYDEDGLLYISHRYKEIIKVDGGIVAPEELESLLTTHASVRQAVVIGIPDEEHGEVPRAFVVPHDTETPPLEQELMDFVKQSVTQRMWIRGGIVFVRELPITGIRKVDRAKIRSDPKSLPLLQLQSKALQ